MMGRVFTARRLAAAMGLIGLGLASMSGPAQAADPAWSVVSSPSPPGLTNGAFHGVSCPSAGFCMAVGGYDYAAAQTLTETWNGSAWSIVASDDIGLTNVLSGVSCVSASFCVATGSHTNTAGKTFPLIEVWNGSGWSIAASAPGEGSLAGVSCLSATSCTAVGFEVTGGIDQTLVESWDGTSWSQVTSPDTGAGDNSLAGVSCLSATSCIAVGSQRTSNTAALQTLVESWDGSTWSIVTSPGLPGASGLAGVSCLSASSCTAVGSGSQSATAVSSTLIETWDGSTWSVVPSPNNGTGDANYLSSVSCAIATFCIAGGSQAEAWNGSSWSIVSSLGQYSGAGLAGVSCLSASFCIVAGWSQSGHSVPHTVAYAWDGTAWSPVAAPEHQVYADTLAGVSCVSAGFCMAVGSDSGASFGPGVAASRTLAESWNGSTWSVVPTASHSQNGAKNSSALQAVSCLSASSCTAVGTWTADNGNTQTLIESWDGSTWSLVPSPNNGGTANSNALAGVSCASASFCAAVGSYIPAGDFPPDSPRALFETWNGTKWSMVGGPNVPTVTSLDSVSCVSASFCLAGGNYTNIITSALAETWNGTSWSDVYATRTSPYYTSFAGVSCTSASSCTAVGGTGPSTLVGSWNGSAFSIVSSPNGASAGSTLNGVSCPSATSCTAVGYTGPSTLVESWDGTVWSVVTSPNVRPGPPGRNDLLGVSCLAASCMAAGDYNTRSSNQFTLIESNA